MDKRKQVFKKAIRSAKYRFRRAYVSLSRRILCLNDRIVDRRVCGQSLVKTVPNADGDAKRQIGGTDTESSHYVYLKRIFSHVDLTASDTVIDVGCGKGRVLAFFLREKCPAKLCGIEYNPEAEKIAQNWTAKYPQIRVRTGDAFSEDFNPYTVLTLSRPFFVHTYCAFIEKLEKTLTHPVTLVSWHEDPPVTDFIRDRNGWKIAYHENTNRIHGLYLGPCTQPFTVWTYDPEKQKSP